MFTQLLPLLRSFLAQRRCEFHTHIIDQVDDCSVTAGLVTFKLFLAQIRASVPKSSFTLQTSRVASRVNGLLSRLQYSSGIEHASCFARKVFTLATSLTSVTVLWLVGAAVFKVSENEQAWTYYQAVYFAWASLLTIGYGDETPASNSGKAFFVIWSLLAVPALTILISDMGDTFVKTFSDTTTWIFTHLIPQKNVRESAQATLKRAKDKVQNFHKTSREERMSADEHHQHALRTLSERLESHIEEEELEELRQAEKEGMYR